MVRLRPLPAVGASAMAVCLVASCIAPASAAYYYYSSSCYYACAPALAAGNSSAAQATCVNDCYDCLLSYSCYAYYEPLYNGSSQYLDYNCSCYWPWWAWTAIVFGVCLVVGGAVYTVLACVRSRRMRKEQEAYMQQIAAQGYPAPPVPEDGVPPPVQGYPQYPYQGYPGAPVYGVTATGYPAQPASGQQAPGQH